ncbi:MAG: (Fe-S)-binding protein [Promethearchaeia archaeon]
MDNKLIFLGCLSKKKYPETCKNAIHLIQEMDPEYRVIEDAPCCGSVTHHVGVNKHLQKHEQYVFEWLKDNNINKLVTICAGCYNYFMNEYPKRVPEFDIQVRHLLQFLNEPENLTKLNLSYSGKRLKIAYHDSCHLIRADPPIIEEPREILNSIQGKIKLKEMENNKEFSLCCGAGGGVYSSFKENADFNSKSIFQQAKRQRAKVLLTPCPFCYTALKRVKELDQKIKMPLFKFEDFLTKLKVGEEILNE